MAGTLAKTARRSEAHDAKRAQIIESCAQLFDRVGYYNTSMQMLADQVGMGKPTLYHYFPSKIAILFAIHDSHITVLLKNLEVGRAYDPADALELACTDILREIATHPGYVRAFMDNYHDLEGQMKDTIAQARRTYLERVRRIITDGIKGGHFRQCDPDMATYAFLGMCNWAYKWYPAMAAKRSPEEVATALCGPLLHGLKAS